jgi:hypothetical protein
MNGNKFASGQILRKPVEVVKGPILAGWAQKSPEPCVVTVHTCEAKKRSTFTTEFSYGPQLICQMQVLFSNYWRWTVSKDELDSEWRKESLTQNKRLLSAHKSNLLTKLGFLAKLQLYKGRNRLSLEVDSSAHICTHSRAGAQGMCAVVGGHFSLSWLLIFGMVRATLHLEAGPISHTVHPL